MDAIRALRDGQAKIFIGLGGNFVQAAPDTEVTAAALRGRSSPCTSRPRSTGRTWSAAQRH